MPAPSPVPIRETDVREWAAALLSKLDLIAQEQRQTNLLLREALDQQPAGNPVAQVLGEFIGGLGGIGTEAPPRRPRKRRA